MSLQAKSKKIKLGRSENRYVYNYVQYYQTTFHSGYITQGAHTETSCIQVSLLSHSLGNNVSYFSCISGVIF